MSAHIRPSVSGNFRPVDHAMPPVAPTDPADLAAAARQVHRIGARLAAAPPDVAEVLAALGLTRTEPRRATWPGMTDDTTRYAHEESR